MKPRILSMLATALLCAAIAQPVWAEGRHEGRSDETHNMRGGQHHYAQGWGRTRDIRHFENRHMPIWRGGGWHHARHEGRLGWWWVVAGTWYFYPEPVYPYPDPYIPPYVVMQPEATPPDLQPQTQYWYYCEASKNYYPYVSSCQAGWKAVPATPPDKAAGAPPN